ncbi:MAG: O-antigen ligase family protein [Kiritimatiellales bacterium]|nr:O-antigen ligase family protein [Kiritimatiellales bacterium]
MELKFIIFYLTILVGVPLGTILCVLYRPLLRFVVVLMVWATCVPEYVGINFVSREFYRSATRGIEFSLVDICALIIFFAMLLQRDRPKFRWFPPLTITYGIYILMGFISWTLVGPNFETPDELVLDFLNRHGVAYYHEFEINLYPLFELSKILRGAFIFLVLVNYIRSDKEIGTMSTAFLVTTLYVSVEALHERYVLGENRVAATLGHANSLSTYMAMMGTVMFGFMLYREKAIKTLLFGGAAALAAVTVILTVSRGGLIALAFGLWLVTTSLLHRYISIQSIVALILGMLVAGAMLFMAADTLGERFFEARDTLADIEYRGLYNKEAKLMAEDHTCGVGLGNFSAWSWRTYAEDVDPDLPPGTPAHNLWFLTLGEVGVPGLVAFSIYWFRFYLIGIPFTLRRRTEMTYAAGAIAVIATMVCHVQNMLQLGYRQTPMFFMNKMLMAIVVAVYLLHREEKKKLRQEKLEQRIQP